jgi:uncharacterized protein YcbX
MEGSQLRVGPAIIGVENLRVRCIVTTFDPDTCRQDIGVLRRIQKEFNRQPGLNCSVVVPGHISAGDTIELIPGRWLSWRAWPRNRLEEYAA